MPRITVYSLGPILAFFLFFSGSNAGTIGMQAARFDPPVPTAPDLVCRHYASQAERMHRIPGDLLRAISAIETGRWDPETKRSYPWPWTVTSGKRHWYLNTKKAAIAKVKKLVAGGVSNIDVGCMQINLYYHSQEFNDLEAAFDPSANMDYAARYLKRLHGETRSWRRAVGRYHSSTPQRSRTYRNKVYRIFRVERRLGAIERRVAAKERYRRWRAEKDEERTLKLEQAKVSASHPKLPTRTPG